MEKKHVSHKKIKKKRIFFIRRLFVLILLILIIYFFFQIYSHSFRASIDESLVKSIENQYAQVSSYAIYGTHLNLEGNLEYTDYTSINLILKNNDNEISLPCEFTQSDNTIYFNTSEYINGGINLETLEIGNFLMLIKITNNDTDYYYSLLNNTEYSNLEYYTITKNNSNNKISLNWDFKYEKNLLELNINQTTLPDNVYDIVIDPGHGGDDVGATGTLNGEEYYESYLNLEISLQLKEYLEDAGYKVKLTRETDEKVSSYEKYGSLTMANDVNAKLNLAIHINSYDYEVSYLKGFEIYIANDTETSLANLFVENLQQYANTTASTKQIYLVENGIYQRFFTEEEIEELADTFERLGVEPYENRTTSTPYYGYLREIGGISTGALNDGRLEDTAYGYCANEYYNSNNTAESYLLELGYINNTVDLKNMVYNTSGYAQGISEAIIQYLSD